MSNVRYDYEYLIVCVALVDSVTLGEAKSTEQKGGIKKVLRPGSGRHALPNF